MRASYVLLTLVLLFDGATGYAQPGRALVFHGPLEQPNGKRASGPLDLVFRLYDAPEEGRLVAGPFGPRRVVPEQGTYSAQLTLGTLVADDGGPRWLEVSDGSTSFRRTEMERVYFDHSDATGKLSGGWTLRSRPSLAPSRSPGVEQRVTLGVTTILDNGPSSNRLDLVFVGDGYTEPELGLYASHAASILPQVLLQPPFSRYQSYFNAHRVDVISNESGVDHDPTFGITRDTALDMGSWCGGTQRAICVDVSKAHQAALAAPGVDQIFALANSETYGGAGYIGSNVATMGAGNSAVGETAIHEFGHTLGDLADEYDYGDGAIYPGGEPIDRNVSTYPEPEMAQRGAKWAPWLGTDEAPFDGPVGTYEGARYHQFGIYRPSPNSKMRSLYASFNLPSVEQLILRLYDSVHPIDDATPFGTILDVFSTAFVTPLRPTGEPLAIQWNLNGAPIPGANGETFRPTDYDLPLGQQTLSVTVTDTTPWVRDEIARSQALADSRSWVLEIGDRSPRVTAPRELRAEEGVLVSFDVTAVDPDGDAIASLTASGPPFAAGATFAPNPSNTGGTFQWTPGFDRAGTHRVDFTASNALDRSISTVLFVANVNRLPSVVAPATAAGDEGTFLTIEVTASDPDLDPVALSAAPVSTDAFFEDRGNGTGSFGWYLTFGDAGTHVIRFSGVDALGGFGGADCLITVRNVDRAPVVVAPFTRSVVEGAALAFDVTASDPDEEAIESLTAAPLPEGALFAPTHARTTGTFTWTPSFAQAGAYTVEFTASNNLAAATATSLTVVNAVRPPTVSAPAMASGAEAALLEFDVTAIDPDGESIDSLLASSHLPGATFTASPAMTSGRFSWTPDYDQAGSYSVTLSAKSACRAEGVSGPVARECEVGTAIVALQVANTDRPPAIQVPASLAVNEGEAVAFVVTALDPDGEPVASLTSSELPFGATFVASPDGSNGAFAWTPSFIQSGDYAVTFFAANALASSVTTEITVRPTNRAPTAEPGGPYAGVAGVPVALDGSRSTDPDGDPLSYQWDLGDGTVGFGPTLTKHYPSGTFLIRLTVSDAQSPPLSATATTTASIVALFAARVFTDSPNRTIRLGSGKPLWCVRVEGIGGNFDVRDLDPPATTLAYEGSKIASLSGKSGAIGDQDKNGAAEVEVCFAKGDLRTLFSTLPPGRSMVALEVEGTLTVANGALALGTTNVDVFVNAGGLASTLSPNPFVSEAVITFSTTVAGPVRVSIYDLQGRLIRTVLDAPNLGRGYHDVPLSREGLASYRLASGVYFFRIEAPEGASVGKFTLLR